MVKTTNSLKPIVHRPANELVYERLREAISSGQYEPGEKLSTRKVAGQLGVSQMPVREAFHRLVAEGAMVKRENRSIGLIKLTSKDFMELTEIRIKLEGMAAAKSASNASKRDILAMKEVLRQLDITVQENDQEKHLALNRKLHFLIYEASGSRSLVQMIELLWLRVGPLLRLNTLRSETVVRSNDCHERMVRAIADGDTEAARAAIETDLSDAAEVVHTSLVQAS